MGQRAHAHGLALFVRQQGTALVTCVVGCIGATRWFFVRRAFIASGSAIVAGDADEMVHENSQRVPRGSSIAGLGRRTGKEGEWHWTVAECPQFVAQSGAEWPISTSPEGWRPAKRAGELGGGSGMLKGPPQSSDKGLSSLPARGSDLALPLSAWENRLW
ncbi:hypothetical protein DFH08DRAFT_819887 [Mycena albidolilacea]|uniref:Uncharacterized protein n=1 Tax=Mycena albidolilacea TaxID=1033008 RepID=A0AAD7EG95_9AGAR|nr:hypothetical protein DFH08DRAFT_819887 [Mycena albidolilacea]